MRAPVYLRVLHGPSILPAGIFTNCVFLKMYMFVGQVVTTAAAEGPGAAARQHLQQALMLAERYRLSAWLLQMRYTETLLLGTHPPTDINEAVEVSDIPPISLANIT